MAFKLNDEQSAILDHIYLESSQILAVNALAGTGKTTTLKNAALYALKDYRARFFVYNKRNADEAAAEFPRNTGVSTAHSFAYRAPHPDGGGTMAEVYGNGSPARLTKGSLYGPLRDQMRQSVDFSDRIRMVRQELRCSEGRAIMAVQSVLRQFCQSASPQIGPENIAPDLAEYIYRSGLQGTPNALLGTAAWVWDRMRDPFSQFPIDHGVYLKLCSLSPPRIPSDVIFLDEAQDASPPMLEILKAQLQYGTRLVLVGDTYQRIYDFTGAVDAMAVMRKDHPDLTQTLPLMTSYRFGPEIADAGNVYLRLMGSPYLLVGKGAPGVVDDQGVGPVNTVLFRGNSELLQAAVECVKAGQKIHVVGGTGEIVNLLEAMGRLFSGEFAKHPELSFFDDWRQLSEYSQTPLGQGLSPLARIVEQSHGHVGNITQALRCTQETPSTAELCLSSAHRSKGGQWDQVSIAPGIQKSWDNKFMNQDDADPQLYVVPDVNELCLQYVAVTRAQKKLYTHGLLDTVQAALQESRKLGYPDVPPEISKNIPDTLKALNLCLHPPVPVPPKKMLIGFSGVPGAGKDTAVDMLIAMDPKNIRKFTFSDALYADVSEKLNIPVEWLQDRANKDSEVIPRHVIANSPLAVAITEAEFVSPRTVLQEWSAYLKKHDPHCLIRIVEAGVDAHPGISVISDVRSLDELNMVESHGGGMARVWNTQAENAFHARTDLAAKNPIERELAGYQMPLVIDNNHGLEDLQAEIQKFYHKLQAHEGPFNKAVQGCLPATRNIVRPLRRFALADSMTDAKENRFVAGPGTDLTDLITFGRSNSVLVELFEKSAPVTIAMVTENNRRDLIKRFADNKDDFLGPIPVLDPEDALENMNYSVKVRP